MSWECHPDNDGEPYIPISMNGKNIPASRDVLWLYTFSPDYSEIDHAYLLREKKNRKVGCYLFRLAVPNFDEFAQVMDENYFWHVRGFKPSEEDIAAYTEFLIEEEDEERPNWLD